MPLIVMCGLPSSGKTTRTNEVKKYFEDERSLKVNVVTDHGPGVDRNIIYADSSKEKELRSTLKSAVQRAINKEDVLILDSSNYIKGYRYELFCVTKSAQTPHCVIHCAINPKQAAEWNAGRPPNEQYSQNVLEGLVMRFETPDGRNRWDSPVFTLNPDDEPPLEQIYDALYRRVAPPPNLSTLSQPLSSTNFLHELDTITQAVVVAIVEHSKTAVAGDSLAIPGAVDKMVLSRIVPVLELQRLRRQFIAFTKTLTIDDSSKIANLFVLFLNNRI